MIQDTNLTLAKNLTFIFILFFHILLSYVHLHFLGLDRFTG
jgi:hypothetical protein